MTDLKTDNLVRKVLLQVQKDFRMAGLDLEISDESDLDLFMSRLEEILQKLASTNFEKFTSLLYVIDMYNVSDDEISEAIQNKEISQLVIKRELQKVVLRAKFSE